MAAQTSRLTKPTLRTDARGLAVFVVAAAVFPLLASPALINIGVFAMIYALAALGLTLLMGLAGQVSLGHAAFFAIGAYVYAIMTTKHQAPGPVAAVAAVVVAMIAAFLVGLPLLRLRGHYLALATLGLGVIVTVLSSESSYTGGASGIFGVAKPEIAGRTYDSPGEFFWLLAPVVAVGLLLARNVVNSRVGRALRAINDSEVAAETLGVNTFRLRLQVFVLSAGFAGLGGVFFASWLAVVTPEASSFALSVKLLLIVVLGGLGTVWGAVLGAFAVEFLDDGMRRLFPMVLPDAGGEVQLLGFGVALILLMLFMPGGMQQAWAAARHRLHRLRRPRQDGGGHATSRATPAAPDDGPLLTRADRPAPGTAVLEVRDVSKRFDGIVAVDDLRLDIRVGEILAMIGPNGAGKTTLFNMVSGVTTPSSGTVTLYGQRTDGRKPHVFAQLRATRTFQNLQVFGSASVLDNVRVGRHLRSRSGLLAAALMVPARAEEHRIRRQAEDFLNMVGLADDASRPAADLPFGRQRLMEIARALALEPDLLLLDEPMAGLSPAERRELAQIMTRLRRGGMGILLVEHDVEAVLALADRVAVLDKGRLIAIGTPAEIRTNPEVIAAYLGVEDDQAGPVDRS